MIRFAFLGLLAFSAVEATGRPNILFVLVDDLGWADVGYSGATFHLTPNIDAFSQTAMIFDRAYTMPTCSPSRASLFTGLNAPHTGIYHVEAFGRVCPKELRRTIPVKSGHHYKEPLTMLAEALKQQGYATGYVGKWHVTHDPTHNGFNFNAGGWRLGGPRSYFSPYRNPALEDGPRGEYLPERLMNESISFLTRNREKPFLLCYAPYSVHRPLQAREVDIQRFRDRPKEEARYNPTYAAMVSAMDMAFGGVLDALEEQGLADNTVVVFTSDNGINGLCGEASPLRGEKGSCYEGGTRVPTIVYWPGKTKAIHTDALIDVTDWYPTLLEIAGAESPEHRLDGVSIVPLLTGAASEVRDAVHCHMPCYNGLPDSKQIWQTPFSSITKKRYKLIYSYENDDCELYDLQNDIGESKNLAHSEPQITKRMKSDLEEWLRVNEAPLPTRKDKL